MSPRRKREPMSAADMAKACANSADDVAAVVILVRDDGAGGATMETGYADANLADAEAAAIAILRDIRVALNQAGEHDCSGCSLRLARVTDALADLERDRVRSTPLTGAERVH